jgi:hypothetical protein
MIRLEEVVKEAFMAWKSSLSTRLIRDFQETIQPLPFLPKPDRADSIQKNRGSVRIASRLLLLPRQLPVMHFCSNRVVLPFDQALHKCDDLLRHFCLRKGEEKVIEARQYSHIILF